MGDVVGENIVRLQQLLNTPMSPPPRWARKWQIEAEHLLHLAHNARDANDLDALRDLDAEADRLVQYRESRA